MGNHIIADDNLGVVTSYRDIPTILEELDFISIELRETWIAMIGFRNVLVHDYTDIDQKLVYDALKNLSITHKLGLFFNKIPSSGNIL